MKTKVLKTVLAQVAGQGLVFIASLAPIIGFFQYTSPEGILVGAILGAIIQFANTKVQERKAKGEVTPPTE